MRSPRSLSTKWRRRPHRRAFPLQLSYRRHHERNRTDTGYPPFDRGQLQVRLRHGHRVRYGAAGTERGYGPLHLGEEERAGVAARMAPSVVPCVAEAGVAGLGEAAPGADRLSGSHLLFRAEAEGGAEVAR